jgi:acyl dehydratase
MGSALKPEDHYSLDICIDDETIRRYADAVGDNNPLHLDDAYASTTLFGRRIAHGGIVFGIISRILGMHLPGPGTVFLEQNLKFLRPIFPGDHVRFYVRIIEILPKNGCRLETQAYRGEDKIADGYALVKLPASNDRP